MNQNPLLYINKYKTLINFMLLQQQWSGLTKVDIDRWIGNFRELSEEEQMLVYKLLSNIIYYSENDLIEILKEGVYKCVAYETILEQQKNIKFNLSQKALKNIYEEELKQSCFVPLLDSDSPHESGNYMARLMVQQGIIANEQSMFIEKVPEALEQTNYKRLIIVDDCVGSGHQLSDFWNYKKINVEGVELSIKELCAKYNINASYLTLCGYNNSIDTLQASFPDLRIFCIRSLSDKQRVFSQTTYVWKDLDELQKAKNLFETLATGAGFSLYGYNDLDFAFIMHKTIPDWSLPLFWKENSDWKLLMRRKNSNV